MTAAQRRYIGTEALIGAVISAAMSVAFVLLLFGGSDRISLIALVGDTLPQGLFIGIMATVVPTMLTRRRMDRGAVTPIVGSSTLWPASLVLRALLAGALAAATGAILSGLILTTGHSDMPLTTAVIGKALWGALLGGVIATKMTKIALARGSH